MFFFISSSGNKKADEDPPEEIEYVFLVDNTEVWRTKAGGVSKVPAYVKVTGELSTESWATNEEWSNDPELATYPDYFIVDYVRAYQEKSLH
jgi:hypothetical protein